MGQPAGNDLAVTVAHEGQHVADGQAWVAAGHPAPGLATVLVGEDPASDIYVTNKQKACAEAGIRGFDHRLAHDATQAEVVAILTELNGPDAVFMDGPSAISGSLVLFHRGMSIAGGTSEIKRNQIGERILGLPRDPLIK